MVDGNQPPSRPLRERFFELLCSNMSALFLLMVVCVILLVLSVISYLYIDRSSPGYVVLQLNLVLLVGFFGLLCVLYYRCYRYVA